MNLKDLSKLKLFPSNTKIYFIAIYDNEKCLLKMDDNVVFDNLLNMINEVWLTKEIDFIEPLNDAVIINFKEEKYL